MTTTRIDPPIPLNTPKGSALAHFLIDYGPENDLVWVCFQDETGECWSWSNREVRAQKNVTMGRPAPETPSGFTMGDAKRGP